MKNKIKLMRGVFKKIHHPIEFNLKSYDLFIDKINNQHFNIRKNTDHQIRRIITQIQSQKNEIEPGEMLVQLFAAIKEICIRCLHLVPTDFQMLGGIALYEGKMVEMQTGEGKTLVAVFAGATCSELGGWIR